MGSKKAEERCLSWVLKYANRSNGKVRSIISLLEGDDVPRQEKERPDFVKKTVENGRIFLLGIEHFRVDQLSKRIHGNEVGSTGIVSENEAEKMQKEWRSVGELTPDFFQKSADDLSKMVAKHMERALGCSYGHYMNSFVYSMGKHLKKVADYKSNLEQLKQKATDETKFAFLIEIHSDFNQLILNDSDGNSYLSKNVKFCPMFEGVVKMLESIDPTEADYIILCFVKTLHSDGEENFTIVPLKTGDIRKQLKQQHIKIYEYAGDDFALRNFQTEEVDLKVTPTIEEAEDGYRIWYNIQSRQMKPEYQLPLCYTAFFFASKYKRERKNYATTYIVQLLMEVYSEYLQGWELKWLDERTRYYSPRFRKWDPFVLKRQTNQFDNKWKLAGQENDQT